MDIHNYKRQFERQVALVEENKKISRENKQTIIQFKNYLLSEGIGFAKIGRYLLDLRKYALILRKTLSEATKEDLRRVIAEIEQTNLAAETKKGFKIMLRKLYRFIEGIDEKGVYPERVKWISIHISKNHKKLPEELLTEEELIKIVKNCKTLRDKALISTLAESGCRIGEIGNMKIRQVSFEEYGARLTVDGKTGMRKILIISSSPYLQEWINQHPKNDNAEAPLWIGANSESISYARISAILKNSSKKAGINKRVYPHLLRHSRATILASIMTESAMKQYFGWGQDSKMCGIYIHMNGKATDEAILRANGIEVNKENKKPLMQPVKCLRCKTINEITNKFCKICGLPLAKEEANRILNVDTEITQANNALNELVKDPEIRKLLVAKIKEKNLVKK